MKYGLTKINAEPQKPVDGIYTALCTKSGNNKFGVKIKEF